MNENITDMWWPFKYLPCRYVYFMNMAAGIALMEFKMASRHTLDAILDSLFFEIFWLNVSH